MEKVSAGHCYEDCLNMMVQLGSDTDALLVHGLPMGKGAIEGIRHGHAWIELNDTVIDPSYGITMPVEEYYSMGDIHYTVKYTYEEMCENALEYGTYGPWDAEFDKYAEVSPMVGMRYEMARQGAVSLVKSAAEGGCSYSVECNGSKAREIYPNHRYASEAETDADVIARFTHEFNLASVHEQPIEITADEGQEVSWIPFPDNVDADPQSSMENGGSYIDESYYAVKYDMTAIITHIVTEVDASWAWDTYTSAKGEYEIGVDCGVCATKEEAMAMAEKSFENPGFTVSASLKRAGGEAQYWAKDADGDYYTDADCGWNGLDVYATVICNLVEEPIGSSWVIIVMSKSEGCLCEKIVNCTVDEALAQAEQVLAEYGVTVTGGDAPTKGASAVTSSTEWVEETDAIDQYGVNEWTMAIDDDPDYGYVATLIDGGSSYRWWLEYNHPEYGSSSIAEGEANSMEEARAAVMEAYEQSKNGKYKPYKDNLDWYPEINASKKASTKEATRTFTYAEQKELEDEVEGKPWLNNADRLKDPGELLSF